MSTHDHPVPDPAARLQAAAPPVPRLGQRYTHRPGMDDRTVTVTGLKQAPDGPLVSYEWRDNGPGTLRGCVPVDVFHRAYEPELTAATPCSTVPCDTGPGEPCEKHEREWAHAEDDHELCGPECASAVPVARRSPLRQLVDGVAAQLHDEDPAGYHGDGGPGDCERCAAKAPASGEQA